MGGPNLRAFGPAAGCDGLQVTFTGLARRR